MAYSIRLLVAAAVLLFASAVPTQAQERERRLWVQAPGVGTGVANIACFGCTSGWDLHGPTLIGTVGVMLSPHLGVGLGLDQWWRSPADSEATSTGTILLHYYPTVRAGAFVEAGFGFSRAEVRLDGNRKANGGQAAFMMAVGYELRLFSFDRDDESATYDVTLNPRVSYVYSPIGVLKYEPGGLPFATGWEHQVLSVGFSLGLTFRK